MTSTAFTKSIKQRLYEVQKGICFYCDKEMENNPANGKFKNTGYTIDHFVPRRATQSKPGRNIRMNSVLSHRRCNNNRGSPDPTAEQLLKFIQIWKTIHLDIEPPKGLPEELKVIWITEIEKLQTEQELPKIE